MIEEQELQAIEARENAATKGPWESRFFQAGNSLVDAGPWVAHLSGKPRDIDTSGERAASASFMAHARIDIPKLSTEVRCLQKVLTEGHIEPCNEERDTEHTLATTLRHIAKAIETGTGLGWEDWLIGKADDIDAALPPQIERRRK